MKRSEALKKLKSFLSYQNPYDDRELEVQVLEFIENVLVMLPPPERFEEVTSYLGYAYYPNVVADKKGYVDLQKSQLWDTEDG